MNQAIKAQWLEALRSGKYEQATHALRKENKFCCLGVLCDLAAQAGVGRWEPIECSDAFVFDNEALLLPIPVQEWAGLERRNPTVEGYYGVADFNDGSTEDQRPRDFLEIANLIEEHL